MFNEKQLQFEGFVETIPVREMRMDYNVISGDLADEVLERATRKFREQFQGFPGLEGTLRIANTDKGKELVESNLPVLAGLNLVDLEDLGIQLCDERDHARIYNDEVRRLAEGKKGFFNGRFWFDVSFIRNPYATQDKLMPWEEELNREIDAMHGSKAIVSVPYRAIVPVRLEGDNSPFGKVSSYSFRLNPTVKDAVRPIEITAKEAQEGYDFSKLDPTTAFPVRGQGKHFYGVSGSKRFSRLGVYGLLGAGHIGDPLGSDEVGRVVVKSAEGTVQK
ncbi:hypothetical protein J4217_00080 [Candidatus Pacearchaeota archaeon]|nr:hypothetical protein [Candidatus Pacearchaeota archaeon]